MKFKTLFQLAIVCLVLFAVTGCADANHLAGTVKDGAGFWRGLWHGICAPFSFLGIMFGMDIGIYDSFNTGNWYNFGFILGIGGFYESCDNCK